MKETLQTASKHFSVKPALCFEYLQEKVFFSIKLKKKNKENLIFKKLLPTPLDAKSVALFLKNTPFLSKGAIGEYIGKRGDFNLEVCLFVFVLPRKKRKERKNNEEI